MRSILERYLPERSVTAVFNLIKENNVHLKIVNERKTRHGDYRKMPNGAQQITVNANLNKYRFLITLIHEIAHLLAFEEFGRQIKPHGGEWKLTFRNLMLPFIRPEIFPTGLLPVIARHFRNPKASSDTDAELAIALKSFDPANDKNYIFEIPGGQFLEFTMGKPLKKGGEE